MGHQKEELSYLELWNCLLHDVLSSLTLEMIKKGRSHNLSPEPAQLLTLVIPSMAIEDKAPHPTLYKAADARTCQRLFSPVISSGIPSVPESRKCSNGSRCAETMNLSAPWAWEGNLVVLGVSPLLQLLHGPFTVPDTFRVLLVSCSNRKLKITSECHAY